jgi:hypothetical protein
MGKKLSLGLIILSSFAAGFFTKGHLELGKPGEVVRNPGIMLTGAEIETQFGEFHQLNVHFSDGKIWTLKYLNPSYPGRFVNPYIQDEKLYPKFNATRQDNLREDLYI